MFRKIHFIAEENLHTDCTNKIREYEMQNIIYQLFLLFTPPIMQKALLTNLYGQQYCYS